MSLKTYSLSLFVISAAILNLLESFRIFMFWWLPNNIYQISIRVFENYGYTRHLLISQDQNDADMLILLSFAILLLITAVMLFYSLYYIYQNKGGVILYITALLTGASLSDMWLSVRIDWFPIFMQLEWLLEWQLWWDQSLYGLLNISDMMSFIATLILLYLAWQQPLISLHDPELATIYPPKPKVDDKKQLLKIEYFS